MCENYNVTWKNLEARQSVVVRGPSSEEEKSVSKQIRAKKTYG
jgi:hypothetical protein